MVHPVISIRVPESSGSSVLRLDTERSQTVITSFVIIDRIHGVCYCAATAVALKLCETIDLTSVNHNTIDLVSDHWLALESQAGWMWCYI